MYRTVAALILIGAACGTLLYGINAQTYGEIEKNRTQKAREIMRSLLKQPLPDKIQWVEGISGSCTQGYFLKRIENAIPDLSISSHSTNKMLQVRALATQNVLALESRVTKKLQA